MAQKDLTSLDVDLDVIGAALALQEMLCKIRAGEMESCEMRFVLNKTGVRGVHHAGYEGRNRLMAKALRVKL